MSGSGLAIVLLAVALTAAAAAAEAADHRAARRAAVDGGFGSRAAAAASQSESSVVGSERFKVLERHAVGDGSIESADVAVGEGSGGGVFTVGGHGEDWGERDGDLQSQPNVQKSSSPIERDAAAARECECGSAIAVAMTAAAHRANGAAAVTVAALAESGDSTGEVREATMAGREPMNAALNRYRTWLKLGGSAGIAIAKKFSNFPTPSVRATAATVAAAGDAIETAAQTARAEMAASAAATARAETTATETTTAETGATATVTMSATATMSATTIPAASTASSLDIVASSASCPPGFYTLRGWNHCYLLSTFKTTRALAREYCYSMGASVELLTIDSTQEHHLVAYLIQQTGASQEADGWWTAGVSRGYLGWAWRLRVRFAEMRFFMWSPAAGGDGSGGQPDWGKCLILQKSSSYFWSSDRCSDDTTVLSGVARHNFVCKAPLATPKPCS